MQMTRYFQTIWPSSSLWLKFYHILATGPDTGLIETIRGSADLDRLKKTPGYTTLRNLLIEVGFHPDKIRAEQWGNRQAALRNFETPWPPSTIALRRSNHV